MLHKEAFSKHYIQIFVFAIIQNQENERMVASPRKKSIISLSTWGPRGTAGLVEEWESRVPIREENRKPRRRSTVSTTKSSESNADTEDQKSQ